MAAQTCKVAQHATLSGTTADSVAFSGTGGSLCVTNRDASVTLYFREDGTVAASAADDNYAVLPLQSKIIGHNLSATLSVVGSGNAYSAEIF
jgi:hypothetical protein